MSTSEEGARKHSGSNGQEGREERLARALSRYLSRLVQLDPPFVGGESYEWPDSNIEKRDVVFDPRDAPKQWQRLRERVLEDPDTEEPSPSNIDMEGVEHLRFIADTAGQWKRKIEDKREETFGRLTDLKEGDDENGLTIPERERNEKIEEVRTRLNETKQKLDYSRYRRKMAKLMLAQVALIDTVRPWGENDVYPRPEARRGNPTETFADLNKEQKRTYVIGKALQMYGEDKDDLPSFEQKKDLKTWATQLDHEVLDYSGSNVSNQTVVNALKETNCWEQEENRPEREGAYTWDIARNCKEYVEEFSFQLSEDEKDKLRESINSNVGDQR